MGMRRKKNPIKQGLGRFIIQTLFHGLPIKPFTSN